MTRINFMFLNILFSSNKKKAEPLTAVWLNGGFSTKLNIRISNKH